MTPADLAALRRLAESNLPSDPCAHCDGDGVHLDKHGGRYPCSACSGTIGELARAFLARDAEVRELRAEVASVRAEYDSYSAAMREGYADAQARIAALTEALLEACNLADVLNGEIHSAYGELNEGIDRRIDELRIIADGQASELLANIDPA